jgi:hypothetical protein
LAEVERLASNEGRVVFVENVMEENRLGAFLERRGYEVQRDDGLTPSYYLEPPPV